MQECGKSNKKGAAIDTFQEMRAKRRRWPEWPEF
jgi:hypothetical protein